MGIVLHWFLPTNGDSRTDLSLGNAVGVAGSRVVDGGTERAPDIGYIGQIARSAEQLGFTGALTPTSSWCEDAWVMTAGAEPGDRAVQVPGGVPARTDVTDAGRPDGRHLPAHLRRPAAAERCHRRRRRGAAAVRRSPGQGGTVPAGRGVPAGGPGAVVGRSGRPSPASSSTSAAAQIVPAAGLAGDLPGRIVGRRDRGRRLVRRRLPDLGRAARRGGREARPGARAGQGGRPRAAVRHPAARDHARQRRRGVGAGAPAPRRPRPGRHRAGPGRSSGHPSPRASGG